MPVTKLTAMIIANRRDLVVSYGGPNSNGKYTGWITLGPEDRYRPLLNSEPYYETPAQAEEDMRRIIKEIRNSDEVKQF